MNPGTPDSINLGRIRLSDFIGDIDFQYVFPQGHGINAYIDQAMLDPTKMPAEYAAFGQTPQPWKLTDVIAEASLIGGIFGKGGGNEVRSAQLLQALQARLGNNQGSSAWQDLASRRGCI